MYESSREGGFMKYFLSALVIAGGLLGLGYFGAREFNSRSNLIEVKGLSEKVVKADVGNLFITIINNGYDKLDELYKKRTSDHEKLMKFLKENGVTDEEIVESDNNTSEYSDDIRTGTSSYTTVRKIRSRDSINIRTTDLPKIASIREKIIKLSSEGVLISCDYNYKLTNFIDLKLEMMKEASENARKNAEVFIAPQGAQLGENVYLRQGEVIITAEDEKENVQDWNSKESQSINKKLRLVVRAGFSKK